MWLALLFVLLASAELASAISIFVPGMGYVSTSDITFVYKTVEENLSCFLSKCVHDPKEKTVLKKKFEAAKPTQGFADYSAIIHTGSFSDLLCKGWNVTEKNSALTDNANKNMITFYGPFDSGKTYLASQLSEIPLPHGITAITDGISILIPSEGVDAYLDTAGYGRSDDPKQKGEREASEDFLQHVAVEAADRIVFVVGPLTRYDQDKFKEMLERISRTPGGCKAKPIYFVHNFKDYAFEEEVQLHIKNDIEKAFGAKKLTTKTGTVFYSSSYESEETCPNVAGSVFSCTITHIVMAMEGSDAGQIWNSNSITYLRALLTAPPSKRTVLTEIIKAAENLAPEKYMMVPPENRSPGTFGFILSETRIVTAGFLGEGVKFLMDYMADAIKKVLFPQKVPLLEFKVKYDSQSKLLKLHITEMSDKEVAEVCASNSIVPRHKSYKFTPTVSTWMYDDCKIIIVVELPGVDDSSVKVSPSFNSRGASLVISGVKDFPAHLISKCKLVSCPTSSIGPFSLMVDVPTSSNLATIDKKMENGILTIKLDVIGSSCKDEL